MHDTKLIRTLRTLDSREMTMLSQFYQAPVFNPGVKAKELLDYLMKYKPAFSSRKLEKEKVYQKIFGDADYDDVKMRLLISDALKAVHQFISVSRMMNDQLSTEMLLLDHFFRSENDDYTLKRFEEFEKKLHALPYRDQKFYYFNYRLEELKNNYFTRRSIDYDLAPLFRSLEGFYFLNKLKLICARLSHNYIFRKEDHEAFVSEIEMSLRQGQFSGNQTIVAYSYCVLLLTAEKPEAWFTKLYDLLDSSSAEINPPDNIIFHKVMENYCIRLINQGEEQYYDQLYQLFERRLMQATEISSSEVKSFTTLCLRMNRPEMVLRFINEKKHQFIPAEIREDAYNYSMAVYWFYMKDYSRVLHLLQEVEYLSVFYKIGSKKLLIETYFELSEWDSLDSAMNAFRVFIYRNKEISDLHKKNNSNFINFLYKLLNSRSSDSTRLKKMQHQLKKEQYVSERRWLMEKIDQRLKPVASH